MSKTKPKHDPKSLPVAATPTDTMEEAKARAALIPSSNAVLVMDAYQGNIMGKDVDIAAMVDNLRKTIKDVNDGDLSRLEAMLLSQATALQTMFTSLAIRAARQDQLKHYNIFTVLALKAQAQSRATISALVDLKYPRQATFIKQANVTNGPQQVNNGAGPDGSFRTKCARTHAGETKTDQPELLAVDQHGSTNLDAGTTRTTSGEDPRLEAVGSIHRPKDTRRQSQGSAQR